MTTASHPELPRRTTERGQRAAGTVREPATRAEARRRLERSPGDTRRERTSDGKSPVRHLVTLVSARPYLDVSG
jgi:hypothetical protein